MKKPFALLLAVLLTAALAAPALADNETAMLTDTPIYVLGEMPDYIKDAAHYIFTDTYTSATTDARIGTQSKDGYIFLKRDNKGDFTYEFTVESAGNYHVGYTLLVLATGTDRATDVAIDDLAKVRIEYKNVPAEMNKKQYVVGLTAYLTAGTHKVTLSLPSDFNDTTVKTLYFHDLFVAPVAEGFVFPSPTVTDTPTEPVAPDTPPQGAVKTEPTDPVTPPAPADPASVPTDSSAVTPIIPERPAAPADPIPSGTQQEAVKAEPTDPVMTPAPGTPTDSAGNGNAKNYTVVGICAGAALVLVAAVAVVIVKRRKR